MLKVCLIDVLVWLFNGVFKLRIYPTILIKRTNGVCRSWRTSTTIIRTYGIPYERASRDIHDGVCSISIFQLSTELWSCKYLSKIWQNSMFTMKYWPRITIDLIKWHKTKNIVTSPGPIRIKWVQKIPWLRPYLNPSPVVPAQTLSKWVDIWLWMLSLLHQHKTNVSSLILPRFE